MAFFTKKTWVARQGTGLNKFSINGATPVTVVNQPDSVMEQGDALSATNLNNLEQRIYNAFLDVDGVFDNIEDGIVLVGRAKADQNGDIIDETYAKQNGYYAELGAGTAEQLVSTQTVDDDDAYLFRTSGGSADIGNRETDEIVGGTLGVNQQTPNLSNSYWVKEGTSSVSADGKLTMVWTPIYSNNGLIYGKDFFIAGHKYLVSVTIKNNGTETRRVGIGQPYGYDITKYIDSQATEKIEGIIPIENPTGQGNRFTVFGYSTNVEYNLTISPPNCIDLTAMFGSEIADYIYALEQATAGAGVAWFRRYFPKPYYPYNAGGLASVKPSSHDTTGFNQWDEEWEVGSLDNTTGLPVSDNNNIRAKNYCRCLPNTDYYISMFGTKDTRYYWYDADKNFISGGTLSGVGLIIRTPENAFYFKVRSTSSYGNVYHNDFCINLSWSGTRNGEYEPFELHSYPLDDSTEYRGIPKLDAEGNLYFNGDVYKSDGSVTRMWGLYEISISEMYTPSSNANFDFAVFEVGSLWSEPSANIFFGEKIQMKSSQAFSNVSSEGRICVYDTSTRRLSVSVPKNTTLAEAQAKFNGTHVMFMLATPTQESVNPFTNPQIVNDWGTEQYVDTRDMPIPVGHNTQYMANLRDKLQHLPNLANADGEYVVKQTGTQMELIKTDNLKKDGYYPTLAVGTADNLKGKGTVGADFTFRTSGGSADIGSGSARLDSIEGNTLMMNQQLKNGNFADGTDNWTSQTYRVTLSASNNVITATVNELEDAVFANRFSQAVSCPQNHMLLILFEYKPAKSGTYMVRLEGSGYPSTSRNATAGTWNTFATELTAPASMTRFTFGFNASGLGYAIGDTVQLRNVIIVDLTQMFGSGNEPTVDEFKTLFPLDYYDYNEGTPLNFKGTGLKTNGFNQWDEEWEVGDISDVTGNKYDSSDRIRSKNYIPVFPNTQYYVRVPTGNCRLFYYDANKNFISAGAWGINTIKTTPSNCYYILFTTNATYGATYKNDICINLSWSGIRNGEYEPYWDSTLDLPITTVKGKASGSDESVAVFPDGMKGRGSVCDLLTAKSARKVMFAYVITGNENFDYGHWDTNTISMQIQTTDNLALSYGLGMCDFWSTMQLIGNSNGTYIRWKQGTSHWDSLDAFKAEAIGKTVYYQLAVPVEYALDEELNLNYRVDDFGTEQLLPENASTPTTSPMIAEIAYAMNAVDTIRNLPKNYISVASMDQFTSALASRLGLTISKTWDSANERYNYSIT